MKKIISKQNIIVFGLSALLFLFSTLISCTKVTDEVVGESIQAAGSIESVFSKMSLEEKETYIEKLRETEEFHKLESSTGRFIPISRPALKDEKLHQVKTKAELMTWIKDNLDHTLFRSVEEAEKLYTEMEQLQKDIQRKFSAINFSEGSEDMIFIRDYSMKRVEEQYGSGSVVNAPPAYGTECEMAVISCMQEADRLNMEENLVCSGGAFLGSCIPTIGIIAGPIIGIVCITMSYNVLLERRANCQQTYNTCIEKTKPK